MSKELKAQATRLGRIFERRGVHLTRAEKLEAMAEIAGLKDWATASALSTRPAAAAATPQPYKRLSPLQTMALRAYADEREDNSDINCFEEVGADGDGLLQYILLEAEDARENVDDLLLYLNAARDDLDQVIEGLQAEADKAWVSGPYKAKHQSGDEAVPTYAASFSDGTSGCVQLAILSEDGRVPTDDARVMWPSIIHRAFNEDAEDGVAFSGIAEHVEVATASMDGQLGVLLRVPLYAAVHESTRVAAQIYDKRCSQVFEALRAIESSVPNLRTGTEQVKEQLGGRWNQTLYTWAFLATPVGRSLPTIAELSQALSNLRSAMTAQ